MFSALYNTKKTLKENSQAILEFIKNTMHIVNIVIIGDKYSNRLLEVYYDFDKHAKNAIKLLCKNPCKNRDIYGVDIRNRQVSNLVSFGNNRSFMEQAINKPAFIKSWLDYAVEQKFILESEGGLEIRVDAVRTPINRLLGESFKDVLGAIKTLAGMFDSTETLPFDNDEEYIDLRNKIKKQEETVVQEVDEKKKIGIQKGLEGLKTKLEQYRPKQLSGYLNGLADSLNNLVMDIKNDLDTLALLKGRNKDSQTIMEIKRMDGQITAKIAVFCTRLERFLELLKNRQNLSIDGELQDHIISDIKDIRSSLTKTISSKPLEGREITIGICNRNPNISLFLGNYTNCCVSIEDPQNIHGGEPPIVDYLTDLGMQLVVASDTTNPENPIPVAVAWTYIGKGGHMVIDNVEANNDYNGIFGQLFTEEMGKYMRDYADTCKLKLVQGSSNNDLVLAQIKDGVDKTYYNRKEGYYLEAE